MIERFKQFRRYPPAQFGDKAQPHDPRDFGRGFDPRAQPDQAQFAERREAWDGHITPLSAIVGRQLQRGQAVRTRNIPYTVEISGNRATALLIPQNPKRIGFSLFGFPSAPSITARWGYGPLQSAFFLYAFILAGGLTPEPLVTGPSNGTVATDDIYVAIGDGRLGSCAFLGYESVLAIEAPR